MKTITPTHTVDLRQSIMRDRVVALSLGCDGCAYLILKGTSRHRRILRVGRECELFELRIECDGFDVFDAQPLGENLLVLAGTSFHPVTGGADCNGRVYGVDGTLIRTFPIGTDATSISSTSGDLIWAVLRGGYFRESIVAVDATGCRVHQFDSRSPLAIGLVNAINVASESSVWTTIWPDNQLALLRHGNIEAVWKPSIANVDAIAALRGVVVLHSDDLEGGKYHMVTLENQPRARETSQFRLLDSDGELIREEHVVARGATIAVLQGGYLHLVELESALAKL